MDGHCFESHDIFNMGVLLRIKLIEMFGMHITLGYVMLELSPITDSGMRSVVTIYKMFRCLLHIDFSFQIKCEDKEVGTFVSTTFYLMVRVIMAML